MPHYNVNDSRGPGQIIIFKAFSFFCQITIRSAHATNWLPLPGSCLGAYVARVPHHLPTPHSPPTHPPTIRPSPIAKGGRAQAEWSSLAGSPADWSREQSRPDKMCSAWLASQHAPHTLTTDPPPHCLLPLLDVLWSRTNILLSQQQG